jgi:hypothetical protein
MTGLYSRKGHRTGSDNIQQTWLLVVTALVPAAVVGRQASGVTGRQDPPLGAALDSNRRVAATVVPSLLSPFA